MALLRTSCCCLLLLLATVSAWGEDEAPPEGYYAFMEAPLAQPPRVRKPPYAQSDHECPGLRDPAPQRSLANLCGDLNKGLLPRNPMGQSVYGFTYPFELLRNKTLQFLSRTLPILREDETLPKVARFEEEDIQTNTVRRSRRSAALDEDGEAADKEPATLQQDEEEEEAGGDQRAAEERPLDQEEGRGARKYCDKGGGVWCMLYKMINGEAAGSGVAERRDGSAPGDGAGDGGEAGRRPPPPHYRRAEPAAAPGALPPTPCPARVEYATPVFARNYQGVWRYVVQIPYEGYFTQTVEVVRCLQTRCHYLEGGGCLSSPRWVSLLVAEVFYPNTELPAYQQRQPRPPVAAADALPPVHDFQNYQDALRKRAGASASASADPPAASADKPPHCDGVDEFGCFQVRLYYDWFLVPGSCKCWKPDYFSRFVRRKVVGPEL